MGDWLRLPLRDWSLLPDDVINLILGRIKCIEDLMAMSSVCRSWRFVAIKDYSTRRVQFPWMMISPRNIFETKGFFNIDRYKHYNILFPNSQHSRYWGSKFGWLVVLSFDRQFHLFNPVTQARLDLPPKPIFEDEIDHDDRDNRANSVPGFVRKALVCRDEVNSGASEDKYIVVAIGSVSSNLSFAGPGAERWVHVKKPFGRVLSAVWCNDRLFFMLGSGALMCYEKSDSGNFVVKELVPEIEQVGIWDNVGLVESSGDLLMVARYYSDLIHWYRTSLFLVYKMDFKNKEWVCTKDLGDCALFVDADDNAMALKTSEIYNCKSNCIYYVEKHWDRHGRHSRSHDAGVFDLKDETVEPCFIRDPGTSSILQQNPIWLMPTLR